jgi:hypothetical protein
VAGAARAPALRYLSPIAYPHDRSYPNPPPCGHTNPPGPTPPTSRPRSTERCSHRTTPHLAPSPQSCAPAHAAAPHTQGGCWGPWEHDDGGLPPPPQPVASNDGP